MWVKAARISDFNSTNKLLFELKECNVILIKENDHYGVLEDFQGYHPL